MAEENQVPSENDEKQGTGKGQVQFGLQRVYLKDLSFESPQGVGAFKQKNWNPKINQDLNTAVNKVSDDLFEVILKITVNVEDEGKTVFLVEVQQAGLFGIGGTLEPKQLAHLLNTRCPEMIFPYARETVDSCAVKGGFPAIMLPPVNFDYLFMQAVQRAAQQAAQEEKDTGDITSN